MGKLYRELFYVPKYGKVSEKVMTVRVTLSAFVIIACLTALSLSAYAWFSFDVSSGTNTIRTADFDITVSITSAEPAQDGYKLGNGEYSVLLTKTGNAKTGFCVVEIIVGETKTTLHTQQMGKDGELDRGELAFTLKISGLSEPATVRFTPYWGTSAYYSDQEHPLYIEEASTVNITADGVLVPNENPQEEEEETQQTPSDAEQTERIHTVAEGEYLLGIADLYDTTAEAIAAYNKLEDKRLIQIGQQLKIPPADWVIPEDTTEQTPTTTPETTEPEVTEPEVTEPEATEPEVTEPEVTEPEVTEPEATEPEATESDDSATDSTAETTDTSES